MQYGTLGLHDNGFPGVVDGWKAVDFLSDGNTGAGHAPNRLLASAAGSISYKCSPSSGQYTTAIRIGDLMYTHLLNSGSLYFGRSVSQGDELGQLMSGSFTEYCGYASQGAGWFHVHWGFPNTGSFEAGGWSLSFADQLWRRASETGGVYSWFLAEDGNACAGPALKSPADGYLHTSSDRTITFGWNALGGCPFSGYTFRVKDTSDMDGGGATIIDTGEGGTSRTETFSPQWDNQELYWGVRAANAPGGASWSIRRYRISPVAPMLYMPFVLR